MKNKLNKIIVITISTVSILFIILIITIKSIFVFKPSFYSYSSYVDEKTMNKINKNYTYKEYGTISEFEYAFGNNKAIAGITSDYLIISLIKEGKISPISKKLIKMNDLKNPWESYFTDTTVEQMKLFDQYIDQKTQDMLNQKYKEYGGNYTFKFSDFVVPYFINDKVIAYDTTKILNQKNTNNNPLGFDKVPTLEETLNKIHQKSKDFKIQWTKNERENIVMGSTKDDPQSNWDTTINQDNYLTWLDKFTQIVEKGTGAKISDIKRNLFDADSDIILNNLINPTSKIDVAYIYNGDALDAYFGNDNFKDIEDGDRLRIVRTKYTTRILDCFIVSSSISENETDKLLKKFNASLFRGMFWTEKQIEEKNEELKSKNQTIYEEDGILRIFDYVNYTPACKGAYEYIYNNYFEDDEIAKEIYEVSENDEKNGMFVKNIGPIDKEIVSQMALAFQKKLNGY